MIMTEYLVKGLMRGRIIAVEKRDTGVRPRGRWLTGSRGRGQKPNLGQVGGSRQGALSRDFRTPRRPLCYAGPLGTQESSFISRVYRSFGGEAASQELRGTWDLEGRVGWSWNGSPEFGVVMEHGGKGEKGSILGMFQRTYKLLQTGTGLYKVQSLRKYSPSRVGARSPAYGLGRIKEYSRPALPSRNV